ncbi:MAG: hypothetical protein V4440_14795 [Pseudomonadota bacterium]
MEQSAWVVIYKIFSWLGTLLPAVFGSAFLIFNDRADFSTQSRWVPFATFIFGIIIGYNGGGALCEWLHINGQSFIAFSMQFTLGWMGIGILVQARKNIPDWLDAAKRKFLG